ncbi:MAG: aminopeptidase P N-terminal domain-containing protein [Gemmatimonadales bacterium]
MTASGRSVGRPAAALGRRLVAWLLAAQTASLGVAHAQGRPERYADWARPVFPAEELAARRDRLVALLQARGGGVALFPSASGATDGRTFRQTNDFLYFTGLEWPQSVLWVDADAGRSVLFGPSTDPRFENPGRPNDFPGRPLLMDPEAWASSGIDSVAPIVELAAAVERLAGRRTVWIHRDGPRGLERPALVPSGSWTAELELELALAGRHPSLELEDSGPAIARLRMVKSAREIALIRRAVTAAAESMLEAARAVGIGVTERTIQGEFEAACRRRGAQRFGFTPIVKSGPNALWPWRILAAHHDRRDRALAAGEVVILDLGCEVDYYTSDIGRTFPVDGRFGAAHRRALELVTTVSDAIIRAVRPGIRLSELARIAQSVIPTDQRRYMQTPSFFGHHIGMDSGDPSLLDAPLEPGMVFTVEPWYYDHDHGVAVFIEDDVLVTATGVEVLSAALPRSAEALELAVGRR